MRGQGQNKMIIFLMIFVVICSSFAGSSFISSSIMMTMMDDIMKYFDETKKDISYEKCLVLHTLSIGGLFGNDPDCGPDPDGPNKPSGAACDNDNSECASGSCNCDGWLGWGVIRENCTCV